MTALPEELIARLHRWYGSNCYGEGWENDDEHDLLVELVDAVIPRPSGTPRCEECDAEGAVVDTITDMIVWHHNDPAVEDDHDFVPVDGRPQVIYDPAWDSPGQTADEYLRRMRDPG